MKYSLLCGVAALTLMASCDKKKDTTCVAGTGGKVAIVTFAKHNGVTIPNYESHSDTAYVKFNTLTSPGTNPSAYDTYFVGEAGEDHIHCEDLKCGSYYIYRTAFDSATNTRYSGGIGVNVTQTTGEVDTAIAVN